MSLGLGLGLGFGFPWFLIFFLDYNIIECVIFAFDDCIINLVEITLFNMS